MNRQALNSSEIRTGLYSYLPTGSSRLLKEYLTMYCFNDQCGYCSLNVNEE